MKALRIILFLCLLCLCKPDSYNQNPVNNPSFETYNYNSSCGLDCYICQATNWNILNIMEKIKFRNYSLISFFVQEVVSF